VTSKATATAAGMLSAAKRPGVSERQIALAWLLAHAAQILPIPGTGSPEHVEENIAAASLELTPEEYNSITDSIEAA
jgi:pyridoxine 4-dehydrogenase